MTSAAFEENAEREIRVATAKAAARHLAPTLIPLLAGILVAVVTWTLAVIGAFSLPMPWALPGLAVPVVGLVYAARAVVRGAVKTREKRRAEAAMTAGERFEASRASLKVEAEARRQKSMWSRYRSPRLWVRWFGITVPKSVLVAVAVALWLPAGVAVAAGLASALWTFLAVWLGGYGGRVDRVADLLTAEGEKPTPEI
jgi:hypothetical protein